MDEHTGDQLIEKLKDVVRLYLNATVLSPSLETVQKNILGQAQLVSLDNCIQSFPKIIMENGCDIDKEHLSSLPIEEIKKRLIAFNKVIESNEFNEEAIAYLAKDRSRLMLFGYVCLLSRWTVVTILSASYLCANIMLRSMFELCVGLATIKTGGMGDRIDAISFFDISQKAYLKNIWKELNGWAHPYGKWLKTICPTYQSLGSLYHEKLFNDCVERYVKVIDMLIVTFLVQHEISYDLFLIKCHDPIDEGIDLVLVKSKIQSHPFDSNSENSAH
jgi:hypothetical protein